jgi:hypothetical protein
VIGSDNDGGIVQLAGVFEEINDAAEILVVVHDPGIMIFDHLFQRSGIVVGQNRRADFIIGFGERAGFAGITFQVVIERGGLGNGDAVVEIEMPARAIKRSVRREGIEQKTKRFFAFLLEPRQRLVGHDVVEITFVALGLGIFAADSFNQKRVVVIGATVEAEVIIPMAIAQSAIDVRFAEKSDFVAGLVKELGDERYRVRDRPVPGRGAAGASGGFVANRAGRVGIESGQQAGARRQAKRIGHERVFESHSFAANPVHVWRFDNGMPGAA